MLIDKLLVLADAQESTASVASTDYIDTLAIGDIAKGPYFVVRIDTAVTASGSATVDFALQSDSASGFATALVTNVSTGAIGKASLTAGKTYAIRIPAGVKRYVRGYATVATGPLLTGKWDMFIAMDVPINAQLIA